MRWEGIEKNIVMEEKKFDGENIKGSIERKKVGEVRIFKDGYVKIKAQSVEEALHLAKFLKTRPSQEKWVGFPEENYEKVEREGFAGDLEKVWVMLEERATLYEVFWKVWSQSYVNSQGVSITDNGEDMIWEAVVKGNVTWEFSGWNKYPTFDPSIVEEKPADIGKGEKYIILEEDALAEFWKTVCELFYASEVKKGRSPIKIGDKIGEFTLLDIHRAGYGAATFDEEGNPKKDVVIVEEGVVRCFYSNRFYANEMGIPCTSSSASLLSFYTLSPTNIKVEKGDGIDDGIFVRNMVIEFWEPMSGDFAGEVYGAYIENRPVKPFVIRGNIYEILKAMDVDKKVLEHFDVLSPKVGFKCFCLSKG